MPPTPPVVISPSLPAPFLKITNHTTVSSKVVLWGVNDEVSSHVVDPGCSYFTGSNPQPIKKVVVKGQDQHQITLLLPEDSIIPVSCGILYIGVLTKNTNTNNSLYKLNIHHRRSHIHVDNKSDKNITILGETSTVVPPQSSQVVNHFDDVVTPEGNKLGITDYHISEGEIRNKSAYQVDGLLFQCEDEGDKVMVKVTNNSG